MIIEEEWRDIKGYEGLYQVSNLGRVRSLDRYTKSRWGTQKLEKGIIMKLSYDRDGYQIICLRRDAKNSRFRVHRLVAEAFIDNPYNYPLINHKDENKANNCVNNLEWCSHKYNVNYGSCIEKRIKKTRNDPHRSKAIRCIETGIIYPSIMEVQRLLGYDASFIGKCCKGRSRYATAYGYHWEFSPKGGESQ